VGEFITPEERKEIGSLGGNEIQDSVKPTAVGKSTAVGKLAFV